MVSKARIGRLVLYTNVALNVFGLLSIALCNVMGKYCTLVISYAVGALYLGVPLFLITMGLGIGGIFAKASPSGKECRRLFFINLALVALIWLAPVVFSYARQ